MRRAAAVVAAAVLSFSACSDDDAAAPPTTEPATTSSSTTAEATTTTAPPVAWPALSTEGPGAVVTPNGVVLAVLRANGDGTFVARAPCGAEVTVSGSPITAATIVLDPGHGGGESGAIGPAGTREKDVNLAIALETERRLEALGAQVVLTRTNDYRITLASRAAIATSLHPALFVSIHHNADPDGPRDGPGAETYFQIGNDASHRAAGLVYEELVQAFSAYEVAWVADTDAGAKYRPASDGGDYYGILRRTAGVPGVLSEAAFISNGPEEQLLNDPAFQGAEAEAITRAAVRFVTTDDPGSGFVEPYPRTQPAGPGGGADGCVDPPLS